jgi:hypothetical protein
LIQVIEPRNQMITAVLGVEKESPTVGKPINSVVIRKAGKKLKLKGRNMQLDNALISEHTSDRSKHW